MESQVLVVDDKSEIATLLGMVVQSASKARLKVITANSGMEVLRNIREGNKDYGTIDLMITDLLMPEMDGYAFLQFFRAERSGYYTKTPVAVVTALDARNINYTTLDTLGVKREDVLLKPLRGIEQLKELVSKYCPRQSTSETYDY